MIVKTLDDKTYDDKFDASISFISITSPGVVVRYAPTGEKDNDTRIFFPWSQIKLIMGERGEHEHELAQFEYFD